MRLKDLYIILKVHFLIDFPYDDGIFKLEREEYVCHEYGKGWKLSDKGKELINKMEISEDFKRDTLTDLYNQLPEANQQFFCKMYGSLEEVKDDQVDWAIQQCQRTLKGII
jgi:hypothetical protein